MTMGFPQQQAQMALQQARGNFDRALGILTGAEGPGSDGGVPSQGGMGGAQMGGVVGNGMGGNWGG